MNKILKIIGGSPEWMLSAETTAPAKVPPKLFPDSLLFGFSDR
jgi:hypothetical protein